MRLFDNDLTPYEEQKGMYPVWYVEVLEMDNIMRVTAEQHGQLKANYTQMLDNIYPTRADARTTRDLEEFLYLPTDVTKALKERRAIVQAHFLGHGHFGEPEIKDLLATFSKGAVTVDLIGGTIVIAIEDLHDFNALDFYAIIEQRKPAHLGLKTILTMITKQSLYIAQTTVESELQQLTVPGLEGQYQFVGMGWSESEYQELSIPGLE